MTRRLIAVVLVASLGAVVLAQPQGQKPMSPPGSAATQVGGSWVKSDRGQRYEGGKWIEITYSRPVKRGRDNLFGSGENYGKDLSAGAPVWRAGANQSTRLKTEAPLEIGGKTVPPGEYSLFVDLKEKEWTLILSSHAAQAKYDPNEKTALWGAYGYTPDKDVVRAPMKIETAPFSMDQFTIGFIDMTPTGGKLAMWWDKTMASVPFRVASS